MNCWLYQMDRPRLCQARRRIPPALPECAHRRSPTSPIAHISVLHSRYFIYLSFPQDVSWRLSIGRW
jgi:hypothetical protein